MNPIKQYLLRRIAESEVIKHFGDLDTAVRNELATSLVRQWLTNDGYAVLVTPIHQVWFHVVTREEGGLEVGVSRPEGIWGRLLSEDWRVGEDEIPGLLHQLNLCQSVVCRTAAGRTMLLRIDPKERAVWCQEQAGDDDETGS